MAQMPAIHCVNICDPPCIAASFERHVSEHVGDCIEAPDLHAGCRTKRGRKCLGNWYGVLLRAGKASDELTGLPAREVDLLPQVDVPGEQRVDPARHDRRVQISKNLLQSWIACVEA